MGNQKSFSQYKIVPGVSATNSNTRISVAALSNTGSARLNSNLANPVTAHYERPRAVMVQRLRMQGISDERVLNAMLAVPRHLFVDDALASRAYEDVALPIGHAQTISQPWIVARMIAAVFENRQPQRVLEIGAGCGYQAAVLGELAREVIAVERIRALYEQARQNLEQITPAVRVRLKYGDGTQGVAALAPFDAIIVAAAGKDIPEIWLKKMAVGARLVAPVGTTHQRLVLVERTSLKDWTRNELEAVRFVPLKTGMQS